MSPLLFLNLLWFLLFAIELFVLKKSINPARFLGIAFFIISKAAIPIWEISKFYSGSGITTSLNFGESQDFELSLVLAAVVLQVASLISFVLWGGARVNFREAIGALQLRTNGMSSALLVLWVIGQGPSLLYRNSYLFSDGWIQLLRPLAFLAPILAASLFLFALLSNRTKIWAANFLAVLWCICLTSIGSRSALLFVVLLLYSTLRWIYTLRVSAFKFSLSVAVLYLFSFAFLTVFSATLYARLNPHGLTEMLKLLGNDDSPSLVFGDKWIALLLSLAISIASIYPIMTLSSQLKVPQDVLLINANPLPTEILGISPNNSVEFILPWLPKALIGELYGSFGPWGFVIWILSMSLLSLYLYSRAAKAGKSLLALGIGLVFVVSMLLALQYPSRVVFRVFSIVYIAPMLLALLTVLKRSQRS